MRIPLICFFLMLCGIASAEEPLGPIVIDCLSIEKGDSTIVLSRLPEHFCVDTVKINSDIPINQREFDQLFGICPDMDCTPKMLEMGCFYLKRWGLFKSCTVSLLPIDDRYGIEINLVGQWRLRSISFQGVLFGKDQIKHMYGITPGQPFFKKTHTEAVEYLLSHYKREGYIHATVDPTVSYDANGKWVDVCIRVRKGRVYRVGTIGACVISSEGDCDNDNLAAEITQHLSKRLRNAKYSSELLNSEGPVLKQFLAKLGYPHARIGLRESIDSHTRRVNLSFIVKVGKRHECIFCGNQFFSSRQLLDCVMHGREFMWHVSGQLCVTQLLNMYKQFGFWEARIELCEQEQEWVFTVDEGKRAQITQVCLQGLESVSERALRKFVQPILKRCYFEKESVETAKSAIVTYLNEQGYWDARIIKIAYDEVDESSNCYTATFFIDEGACQTISAVEIPGYEHLMSEGPFLRFAKIRDPIPLKMTYLDMQRHWLRKYFQKHGYRQVQAKAQCVEGATGMILRWDIQHDQSKITFGKPVIKSPASIYPLIEREVKFCEGETWSKQAIEQTFSRISSLGVFDDVHVFPSGELDPCGRQPILIDAQVDQPFEIKTRIGYQQVSRNFIWRRGSTYRIGGSFLYKNPTNNADIFKINLDLTRWQRKFDVSYSVPWTFGQPIRTIIKGYSNKFDQPVYIGKKDTVYEALQDGGLMCWQYKVDGLNTALNVGGEGIKITRISDTLAQVIDFAPILVGKRIPYFYLEPNIFYESLNDKLNPSRGLITLLTAKAMIPVDRRATYFVKALAEQAIFVPFARCLIGAARIRVGHIFTDNFRAVVPPERFYLGGANSVRSYLPDFAPPLGRFEAPNGEVCCFPQGGDTMLNANVELRFPLYRSLTGVVFTDLGVLTKPESDDPLSQSFSSCCECCDNGIPWEARVLGAIGGGVRYHTPIGPLRFDIGWKPYRLCQSESRFAWFLTLGHAF